MSWLSRVADALEDEYGDPVDSSLERFDMTAIEKLVVSRKKTIAVLEGEIAEYEAQIAKVGATSPAGVALASVVKVKASRLLKVRAELAGFEQLVVDPRQLEVPGAHKAAPKR